MSGIKRKRKNITLSKLFQNSIEKSLIPWQNLDSSYRKKRKHIPELIFVCNGVRAAQSLVFCECCFGVDHCLWFCPSSLNNCGVCLLSIYGF
jgi:hypothetical protein